MSSLAHPASTLEPKPKGVKVKGVKGCRPGDGAASVLNCKQTLHPKP